MSTEITILNSGVIVSEVSFESVQWPKFWFYLYIHVAIYRHIYFCGGTNVIDSMKLCNTKPPM